MSNLSNLKIYADTKREAIKITHNLEIIGTANQNVSFDCQVSPSNVNVYGSAFQITFTLITNNFPAGSTSAKIRINNPSILNTSNIIAKLHNYSAVASSYSVVNIGYAEPLITHKGGGFIDLQFLSNGYADMLIGQSFKVDFLIF
jgi:hypothetical protein